MSKPLFLKGSRLVRFEALQEEIVPLSKLMTVQERESSRDLVNLVLADKPLSVHYKILVFLYLIDFLSLVYGGHCFKKLKSDARQKLLRFFFHSPVGLLRKGFWGLSTLAKMGVYGQESVYPKLNYQLKETPYD